MERKANENNSFDNNKNETGKTVIRIDYNPSSGVTFRENRTSDVQVVGKGYNDEPNETKPIIIYPGIAYFYLRTVLLTILEYDFIPVKKLQYWNNFLYQYCQQYWYTSIVIAKYRRSVKSTLLMSLDVGKSRILTMRGLTKTRTKRKDTGSFRPRK